MKEEDLKFEISKVGLYITVLMLILSQLWFMTAIILFASKSVGFGVLAAILGFLFMGASWFASKYFKSLSRLKPGEGMPPLVQLQ